jgi:hypothetical protein
MKGSVQIITDPDPGGPKDYGSYISGTMMKRNNAKTMRKKLLLLKTCSISKMNLILVYFMLKASRPQ